MYERGFMLEHLARRGRLERKDVLDQVTKFGPALEFAPEFCNDKEIVLAAVKSKSSAACKQVAAERQR